MLPESIAMVAQWSTGPIRAVNYVAQLRRNSAQLCAVIHLSGGFPFGNSGSLLTKWQPQSQT